MGWVLFLQLVLLLFFLYCVMQALIDKRADAIIKTETETARILRDDEEARQVQFGSTPQE